MESPSTIALRMATQTFRASSILQDAASAVFNWHARSGAFQRLVPPWAPLRLEQFEGIREGDRAVLRVGPGPLALRWVAEHHDVVDGRQFCDRQVQGPFALWNHTHRFEPTGDGGCRLVDQIEYALPGGRAGDLVAPWVEPELRRQFTYRHRVTRHDLTLHRRYKPEGQSLTVAVSGTSGLIGSQLVPFLTTGGHEVKRLVRSGPPGPGEILWDPRRGVVERRKLEGIDALVHLAGEPVAGVWTQAKKARIYQSRVAGTRLLAEALAALDNPPDVFVSASGIGYYGDHGADTVTEDSETRDGGFLADVCREWEAATEPAAVAGIRTVQARMGVVLSPAGGALRIQHPLFSIGLGGHVTGADPFVSWIGIDDVLGGLYHLLYTEDLGGPVNLTAPTPTPLTAYASTLADVLDRRARLRIPSSLLRSVFGEMADEMILTSARVVPERLLESGFTFESETLGEALRHVLGKQDERTAR